MKFPLFTAFVVSSFALALPACNRLEAMRREEQPVEQKQQHSEQHAGAEHGDEHGEGGEGEEMHKILVTSPVRKDVVNTQRYVCQIHSRRHIEVCALEGGYLQEIRIKEGQAVKKGETMFEILPVLLQAKLNADKAEAKLAEIEYKNSLGLFKKHFVSDQDVALAQARLAKAQAKVELAQAELNFTDIKAPFDGIVDRQLNQQGSLIEEGDVLTTLSDNDVMWVYFNVPEARYLEYKATMDQNEDMQIELELANGEIFPQPGEIGAIEADFNNENGNIAFRADFPNPDGLLRNGQTGTILIHRPLSDALVIPQRAVFEILAKQFVYVVGDDDVVRQRAITVQNEMPDIFVVGSGLKAGEKIVLEGIREVRDGDHVEYEFRDPQEVLANLKYRAQ